MVIQFTQHINTWRFPIKHTLFIILVAIYLTLTGCASNGPTILGNEKLPQSEQLSQTQAFQKGLIRLDCAFACGAKLGANLKEIDALLYARSWNELAAKVMDIGYGGDLTYYYLGRAAEGLGYLPAAKTYYELSLNAEWKCDAMTKSTCQGHNFPDDAKKHLSKLDGK